MCSPQAITLQRLTTSTFIASGEDRIVSSPITQAHAALWFRSQSLFWQRLTHLGRLLVVCGCLGTFGIVFSTLLAHPRRYRDPLFALSAASLGAIGLRREDDGSNTVGIGGRNGLLQRATASQADALNGLALEGAASAEIQAVARDRWLVTAKAAGIDLTGFDPSASLAQRIAWAVGQGLEIATVLARYSSKLQHSTQAQVEENVHFAGWHKMYVPPELISVDEGVSGRKSQRDGLNRCRFILGHRLAQTLLVFKVSRLFRASYQGYRFFHEEIVEESLRAISISQQIDTRNEKQWKCLMYLHGIMDEMLLETIADHVRAGLKSLAGMGYVTGPMIVGFRRAEVPGAPPTKLGRPRTMPEVDPIAGDLIRQHFEWFRDGMTIREGLRRWQEAGGPAPPHSKLGYMSAGAYRRMLSNPRYTGLFAFGRTRSVWSSKREYTTAVLQPETEVVIYRSEELRIVSEELFLAVQQRLAKLKLGRRGPNKRKDIHLWDLVTDLFLCAGCGVRFYVSGARGRGMACKNGIRCPCRSTVVRKEAIKAICAVLAEILIKDRDLVEQVIVRSQDLNVQGDEEVLVTVSKIEKKILVLTRRIDDLSELAGQGSETDRRELKGKVQGAQLERANAELELQRLRNALCRSAEPITSEQVREILTRLPELLEAAADGRLGPQNVYRAAAIFRRLVGERVVVHVEPCRGRKRTSVRGVFRPNLLATVANELQLSSESLSPAEEVSVWLRQVPQLDLMAQRAHQLVDIEGKSYRQAEAIFKAEGHGKIDSGVVWQLRKRYFEMIGEPAPKRPYNNGRPRKSD